MPYITLSKTKLVAFYYISKYYSIYFKKYYGYSYVKVYWKEY